MLSTWIPSGYERMGLTLPFSPLTLLFILLVLDIGAFVRMGSRVRGRTPA